MSTNVVAAVVDLLAEKNPSAATRFTRQFRSTANTDKDEIVALNRFWRDQLSSLHVSTISERACLVDDIATRDWLRHFRLLVLPLIVKNDLPTVH